MLGIFGFCGGEKVGEEWGGEEKGRTYDAPNRILVKGVPTDGHDHRVHDALPPPSLFLFSPFSLFLVVSSSRANQHPLLIHIQPRPSKVDPALDVFVPADAEAGEGYVGGRDAELWRRVRAGGD